MKIKLALLEKDANYLNRFVGVFSTKYAEKVEIYSFTDKDVALKTIEESRIDVLIASDAFEIEVSELPKKCCFAYFVDSPDLESLNEQRVICKFQKLELIYKQILSLYAEKASNIADFKIGDGSTSVIGFVSPSGGVGSSALAAACALHQAQKGKKVLYLNLEKLGSSDKFFEAEGQFDMSDVIFAIKSKKTNLSLKLESCVKVDNSGVYFYSETKNAMDMMELKTEEYIQLISELKISGTYDFIIVDIDFSLSKDMIQVYQQMNRIILVGDGSVVSNGKVIRAYQILTTLEYGMENQILPKVSLIYNKFSSKTSQMIEGIELKSVAGIQRFEHATVQQVITHVAGMDVFSRIFE